MEYDVHTILDMFTLAGTGWVMYMMYFKLKTTYQADKDTLLEAYIVRFLPAVLAIPFPLSIDMLLPAALNVSKPQSHVPAGFHQCQTAGQAPQHANAPHSYKTQPPPMRSVHAHLPFC